jgi:transposase
VLRLPANVRIFIATAPCDMRRQFDGLAATVRSGMDREPKSGDLYLFRNRRGDMVKILFFDRQGYCLLAKRLCRGRFRFLLDDALLAGNSVEITPTELGQLLSDLALCRQSAAFVA